MTDAVIRPIRIPRSMAVAAMLVIGVWFSDAFQIPAVISLISAIVAWLLVIQARRSQADRRELICLWLLIVCFGAAQWSVRNQTQDARDVQTLVADQVIEPGQTVRLRAKVANIPALETPTGGWTSSLPQNDAELSALPLAPNLRTLFLVEARELITPENGSIPVRGRCRVLVEGDATPLVRWGDRVELLAALDFADGPMNPGEFDFRRHLERNRISAMLFVNHTAAIRVENRSSWSPLNIMTIVRQLAVDALQNLSPRNRGTAEALLLGNRGHLTSDLERDYIASGTMHLLAISGLHVGILYVFLVRIGNLLLVPRSRTLVLAGLIVVFYCLLTDLRPSVLRATVFIVLSIIGQLCYRDVRMGSQIGATSIVLILIDPAMVFDIGAWLSFLAVGALGWVTELSGVPENRPLPPDETTWRDRLLEWWHVLKSKAALGYRQMLAVTLLSAPVVATQFHVVSLVGMVINILLIPFTTLTLIAGYVLVFFGLLLPPVAFVPAAAFDLCLSLLNGAVSVSADLPLGFVTISDLPAWFLPTYYGLLAASALAVRSIVRQSVRLVLLLLVILVFWNADRSPRPGELICTTLSVGHGNAIVVETPDGRVLLFDAGALNRAERTADVVCRFLWHRGYRMLDAIVISHPDADHYNAVQSLLDRMPVGQILLTTEFARAESPDVQAVVSAIADARIPVTMMMHGDHFELDECRFDFFKAKARLSVEMSDNSSSLVCVVTHQNRRICLPGDLEGEGQKELLSSLPICDLLVSPHHGSPASNTHDFARTIAPADVFVSAREHERRAKLEQVFPATRISFTSELGALTYRISADGQTSVSAFRSESGKDKTLD